MTLKDLVNTNAWLSVEIIFKQLYADDISDIMEYKAVFEKLVLMSAEEAEMTIKIVQENDEFDGEEYADVSGIYKYPDNKEEAEYMHALEFTPWNQWLGMEISPESLTQFSELEIISHCLSEMTYMGFTEEEIKIEFNGIDTIFENHIKMKEEEKFIESISIEDLLKKLEKDESDDK